MAIQQDQFQATPYTSTVPLVQVPPQAIEQQSRPAAPLQGQFGGHKGTGGLLIGDALLKGFMAGHQQKEQKQQAKAQATINAADAASEGAYRAYQDALTKAGGKKDDPAAQAAYQSYVATFQAGKQAKAQYVIPDKTQKGKKAAGDTDPVKSPDDKKKKGAVSAGFNNIKDFFEANPHIVPQIALLTMQPKPQGLSTEGQQQVQSLESGKIANEEKSRKLQNEKTYQEGFSTFSHLSPDEVSSLPPDAKKNYDTWQNARASIAPTKYSGTTKLYQLSNGKKAWLHPEEASAYYPDAQPVESTGVKPGSDAELEDKYLKSQGITREGATAEQLAAATQYARAAKIPSTATTSTSTSDPLGNRTTTTSRKATAGGIQPPPSASRKASPASGGITHPPTSRSASEGKVAQGINRPPQAGKTAKAGMTPPPRGKETALTASVTRQAVKAQQEGYQKAEKSYSKALEDADKAFSSAQKAATTTGDPSILATAQAAKDRAVARARLDLEDAKASVAKEYDAAVKSIGGSTGGQSGGSQEQQVRYYQGHPYVQDAQTGQWNLQQGK